MTVLSDIRRHWILRQIQAGEPTTLEWRQKGGTIHYVGTHPIHIREVKDGKYLFIHGGPTRPCFTVELFPNQRHAILQGIQRGTTCFADNHPESRDLVRAAAAVARQRGMLTMELTDNSKLLCPQRVTLSDLSFLTTGQTWYESILPNLTATDAPMLEIHRVRVRSNTWRIVGEGLPMFNSRGIDVDAPGSAMTVLARAKENRQQCADLAVHMGQLLFQSGIYSLYGHHWICRL